jgi:hypothetical protein
MSWISRFERRLEPFAISNLTLFLVIGQTFVLLTTMLQLIDPQLLVLRPSFVKAGEWWRLFTFVFMPPNASWLFVAFALYLLYLYGSALEHQWGALRYNLFLFTGYALTVGLAFVTPYSTATNVFIGGAVFLAFAWLNPNFEILVFFVLPVKIKWMALIAWLGYAYTFATGGLSAKLGVTAAVGNFLLFFGHDLWLTVRHGGRRLQRESRRRAEERAEAEPRHRCVICGRTEMSHPELDFRYCSKCAGDLCYCSDHLRTHEHVTDPAAAE